MLDNVTISVSRRYKFSAAHHLPLVADDHKCKRVHGHNYVVDISLRCRRLHAMLTDGKGFIIDFWDLDKIVDPVIKGQLDHRDLNEVPGLENPTAENIAYYLFIALAEDIVDNTATIDGIDHMSITVHEEDDCSATFSAEM